MFHSDVEFGAKYADCVKEEALEELESETKKAFPHCPEPSQGLPIILSKRNDSFK